MTVPDWMQDPLPYARALAAADTPTDKIEAYKQFVRVEIARRKLLLDACEKDPGLYGILQETVYAQHGWRWCNDWVYVENYFAQSIGLPLMVPLYLYGPECLPAQRRDDPDWVSQVEVWEWWDRLFEQSKRQPEAVEGLLKKSREMAISYMAVTYGINRVRQQKDAALYVSVDRDRVDVRDNPKSLLEKGRIVLEHLPDFVTGGWVRAEDGHDKLGLLTLPISGGQLKGAWGADAGVSDRCTFAFSDEDAINPNAASVSKALSKTARVIVRVTTTRGPGTDFAAAWAKNRKPRAFLHWTCDPFKDSAYGGRYEVDYGKIARAQELDGDDEAATTGGVIPLEWLVACIQWQPPEDQREPRTIGYDPAGTGKDSAARALRIGPAIVSIEGSASETPREGYVRVQAMAAAYGATVALYDDGGGYAGHFASAHQTDEEQDGAGFAIQAVTFGGRVPKNTTFDDQPKRKLNERFANVRAAIWWNIRERARKTWETVTGVREWPAEECLSLPDRTRLREDLLMPQIVQRGTKIGITSKKDLPRSPDEGDAVCMAFADDVIVTAAVLTVGRGTPEDRAALKAHQEMLRGLRRSLRGGSRGG